MTALAKLPEKWREEATKIGAHTTAPHGLTWDHGACDALNRCADELTAALSPAELGGVVTFDVVREVVKARTRLGFASPEGQEEQAARAIELIRELCEEVVSLNSASWVAEVITVTEPGDKGVRIRWRGGFPQVGDKLYTTPRAAEADWLPIESAPKDGTRVLGTVGGVGQQVVVEMEYKPKLMEWHRPMQCGVVVKPTHWQPLPAPSSLTPPSAKGENK